MTAHAAQEREHHHQSSPVICKYATREDQGVVYLSGRAFALSMYKRSQGGSSILIEDQNTIQRTVLM